MEIEKAFAIKAEPADIWNALWHELGQGDQSRFVVEQSHWPHGFTLRLDLAGLPSLLTYRIKEREEHCEVSATLQPLGRRYGLFQLLTFGHLRRNYEVMLVQGLINLKEAVEGEIDESTVIEEDEPVV